MSGLRRFELVRAEDLTGVSGTGVVVDGVQFPDGTCAYRWRGAVRTTVLADTIADVETIHGHDGRTTVRWIDT